MSHSAPASERQAGKVSYFYRDGANEDAMCPCACTDNTYASYPMEVPPTVSVCPHVSH